MKLLKRYTLTLLSSSIITLPVIAGDLDIPTQFTAGTPAVAADVNDNFNAVKTAVDDNAADIRNILNTLNTMQNFITEVLPNIEGGIDAQGNAAIFFSGVNVHINNGEGSTYTNAGTGNLIIGYDEASTHMHIVFCSIVASTGSAYDNQVDCENNGGNWVGSQKTGSHNVIIGSEHNYTQAGALIAGYQNSAVGHATSITGGSENVASGANSHVSAGSNNISSGVHSVVSGGSLNTASARRSVVSSGFNNIASGGSSSASGGQLNTASGTTSSVSGGFSNTASGFNSSVTGGQNNTASAESSSVSGGYGRSASAQYDWVAGSLTEDD